MNTILQNILGSCRVYFSFQRANVLRDIVSNWLIKVDASNHAFLLKKNLAGEMLKKKRDITQ